MCDHQIGEIIEMKQKGLVFCVGNLKKLQERKNEFHTRRPHERQTGCIIEKFHAKYGTTQLRAHLPLPKTGKKSMDTFIRGYKQKSCWQAELIKQTAIERLERGGKRLFRGERTRPSERISLPSASTSPGPSDPRLRLRSGLICGL